MMQAILAKIGKGPKTAKDLTWEEAKQAMRALIEGNATPLQAGAFLLAMRMKMESVSELAAFTAAAREYVVPVPAARTLPLLDVPTYAGKQDTFHGLAAAAIVAVAGGAAVLMHGHDSGPSRASTMAVLNRLGIPVDSDARQAAEDLRTKGFAYLDIALYHPPVARFLDLREELGVRTVFHPVAKMLNPARAGVQIIGISHPPYFEKVAEALKMLGAHRALVIRGVEGEPELSLAGLTRVLELREERIIPVQVQPKTVGLAMGTFHSMAACPPEQETTLLRRILHGEVQGGPRDWVVMNAAMLLYGAGKAVSVSAGVPVAQRVLDSGAAAQKLAELALAKDAVKV
jgi:anthranilate phosphoribosyltransferase